MTPHSPLKLAFIGGGKTSAVGYVHFVAAQMDNYFEVVAGAFCRQEQDNLETANQWGVSNNRCYSSWEELIRSEKGKVDAFVVLTPTPDHISVLVELLKNNLPIICEKALVGGPAQVRILEQHYNPEKHFLAVTFNYTGYGMVRELRRIIQTGELGDIHKLQLEMPQEGFIRPPDINGKSASPQPWRLEDGEIPTICLDLGVHLHHMAYFLCGQIPKEVIADYRNDSNYTIVDDVNIMSKYTNKLSCHMWFSKTAIGHRNGLRVRVYGTKGSAEWFQLNPDELIINRVNGSRAIIDRASPNHLLDNWQYNRMKPGHPSGFIEAFANIYIDFAEALYNFKQNAPYCLDSYNMAVASDGLSFFSLAHKSVRTQKWESF